MHEVVSKADSLGWRIAGRQHRHGLRGLVPELRWSVRYATVLVPHRVLLQY